MAENQTTNISQAASVALAVSFNLDKTIALLKIKAKKLNRKSNFLLFGIVEKIKSFKKTTVANPANVGYSQRPAFSPDRKKKLQRIYAGIAIIFLVVASFFLGRISKGSSATSTYADTRPLGPNIQAEENVNKNFSFPLLDSKGVKVSTIDYKITSADIEDSIIVNGQRATAVKGRTFLVINLEITNNDTQAIQINSKDYIRLQTNGQGDWVAADIHNDPVTVQAISTKITRIGFPINDTDKNLVLQVGEITGTKQFVKLTLVR